MPDYNDYIKDVSEDIRATIEAM